MFLNIDKLLSSKAFPIHTFLKEVYQEDWSPTLNLEISSTRYLLG